MVPKLDKFFLFLKGDESYDFVSDLLLRGIGFIYFIVFLIVLDQGVALLGENGLLPIPEYTMALKGRYSFWQVPSLFWFGFSDRLLLFLGFTGLGCGALLISGRANLFLLFIPWLIHLSIVNSGQIFYSYGWEMQILEMSFLAFFLVPLLNWKERKPSRIVIWFFRFTLFRLMLGAGLIKLRGDACWTELTCMIYHYETQPNPHILSWFWHRMPDWFHTIEVLGTHLVEVILPFAVFGPRKLRNWTGVVMVVFQIFLILSGNLSWLNWVTLVLCFSCFDDEFLRRRKKAFSISKTRGYFLIAFTLLGLFLGYRPLVNLFSSKQAMNRSYDSFHLINSYGAFGSIGKVRNEIIVSGSEDGRIWREYEFKCKPGDVEAWPCWITPYHHRLDWQIWFSAMRPQISEAWLAHFSLKLLQGDEKTIQLLKKAPFKRPKFLKMDLYRYEMTDWGEKGFWKRKYLQGYMPIVTEKGGRLHRAPQNP